MNRNKNTKKQTIGGILFLQGVFKSDCDKIEDFFHDKLLNDNNSSSKIYDKIPMIFTNLDSWPKTINLLCWNCKRTIKGRPWFEPQSIDPICTKNVGEILTSKQLIRNYIYNNNYYINVKGCFCSPNCVMRYIHTYSKNLADRINKISMLLMVYEIFVNVKVRDIPLAPMVTDLIQYGGTLTEQDYQNIINDANSYSNNQENLTFVKNCKTYFNLNA